MTSKIPFNENFDNEGTLTIFHLGYDKENKRYYKLDTGETVPTKDYHDMATRYHNKYYFRYHGELLE